MLLDVRPDHLQIVQDILQKHVPQYEVWAFGSRAKWTAKEYSDLDLCIVSDKPLSFSLLGMLADEFSESDLPYKVDIVDWATTSPSFRKIIERDKEVVQKRGEGLQLGWSVTNLGRITKWLSGGTPKKDVTEYWGGDIPWISANSMHSTRIADSELKITHSGLAAGSRIAPKDSILLLVRGGALHNRLPIGIATRDVAFNQDVKALIVDKKETNPWYLLYWLMSQERLLLESVVEYTGIGAGKLDTARMQALEVLLPPLSEQEKILELIKSIDDKIALLHETNATLEAIAQAIFKSWFVDFDPVRAKMEGREPEGMDAETAALFPDSFEDSELGEIPKGWKVKPLEQACEINPTRRLSKGAVAPYLEMAAIPTQGHRTDSPVQREFSSGTKFINGDTLLARITPCLENGKTAFVDFLAEDEIGWGSTEYIVLRPKQPLPAYWAYLLCRHQSFRQFAIQAMVGTSGRQRVDVTRLAQYMVATPDEAICAAFAEVVEPIQRDIAANAESMKTLANLRDTLLPRLMSGKLVASSQ